MNHADLDSLGHLPSVDDRTTERRLCRDDMDGPMRIANLPVVRTMLAWPVLLMICCVACRNNQEPSTSGRAHGGAAGDGGGGGPVSSEAGEAGQPQGGAGGGESEPAFVLRVRNRSDEPLYFVDASWWLRFPSDGQSGEFWPSVDCCDSRTAEPVRQWEGSMVGLAPDHEYVDTWSGHVFYGGVEGLQCVVKDDAPNGEYVVHLTVAPGIKDDEGPLPPCGSAMCVYGREYDSLDGTRRTIDKTFLWPDDREVVVDLD